MTAAVLLVDDEKTVLDALRTQIKGMLGRGIICETAERVDEAWEVLDELAAEDDLQIILIISDWLMPGTRGDAFLEEVQKRYPGIYRVMLTGQADASALSRVRDEGLAHLLLFKPWQESDLQRALDLATAS